MKKLLLSLMFAGFAFSVHSQCVLTCSNYASTAITHSVFPAGSNDVVSQFLPNQDDGSTGAIPIGFTFTYYCNSYTDVYICSNGFLQFSPVSWSHGSYVHPTTQIPFSTEPNNMVAFNMTDLDPSVGGNVFYNTVGTAPNRMFVVTYSNVPAFGTSNMNTGQIVLYETTNIIEIHTSVANGAPNQSGNGSQGIENSNGSIGVPAAANRNNSSSWFPGTNTAYRFQLAYQPAPPASVSGNTQVCQGSTITLQTPSVASATSYSWTAPSFWTGSSTTSAVTFTAAASGNVSVTATYSCGTSKPTTMAINVIPGPVISINSATPTILCSGTPVTFSVSGADTYTLYPGGITGQMPMTDMPNSTTVYSVMGTSSVGCTSVGPATVLITVNETPTVYVNSGAICLGETFKFNPVGASNGYSYSTTFSQVTPTAAGLFAYTVVGTSTNGCVSAPAVSNVTVNALPVVVANASRTLICRGETSKLTVSGATSYTWSHNSSNDATLTVNPITFNNYVVTGKNANGCSNSTTVAVNVSPCSGIAESAAGLKMLNVYPNPSAGEYLMDAKVELSYSVYDINGKQVHVGTAAPGVSRLNLTDLAPGQYFLRAESEGSIEKFVIIKN